MRSWHRGTFADLLAHDAHVIASELAAASAERRLAPNPESMAAWTTSAQLLQSAAREIIGQLPQASGWYYALEYEIPRRSRRIDATIVADDIIYFLEFKVGADQFDRSSIWQIEQYALDMRDFHSGCEGRVIVPLLVATAAAAQDTQPVGDGTRLVQQVGRAAPSDIAPTVAASWNQLHRPGAATIDGPTWEDAAYHPTPTIIEAARLLYDRHDLTEVALAGAHNLDETVSAVLDLIDTCRRERRRGVALITGAPGSGKTLAGLQIVHAPEVLGDIEAAGVFLSGNMPLVEVISAALIASAVAGGAERRHARREVSTFIQHAYAFRNAYAERPEQVPSEHVILFDEAQRAWDAAQVTRWTRGASTRSEPEILLEVMSRVPGWAVVIALIGNGQEINRGEAGIGEWGRALAQFHPDWLVRAAPEMLPGSEAPPGGRLFDADPSSGPSVVPDSRLHLKMNVRSPRAERLNQWVDSLLSLQTDRARQFAPDPADYPMAVTRSFQTARDWLREHADEDQRCGLVASAEARRLRAWGIDTKTLREDRAWADWYLKPRGDVRSSNQLELPATNFDCQGLEIDWAGVCWGNDLIPDPRAKAWATRRFLGTKWTTANAERHQYILNGYRVLLTRARRGQVIWVPKPEGADSTLPPAEFDTIADLLVAAGVPAID